MLVDEFSIRAVLIKPLLGMIYRIIFSHFLRISQIKICQHRSYVSVSIIFQELSLARCIFVSTILYNGLLQSTTRFSMKLIDKNIRTDIFTNILYEQRSIFNALPLSK